MALASFAEQLQSIITMGFETVTKKDKTQIVNADCPYGFHFCYEKKWASKNRFIREQTCQVVFRSRRLNLHCPKIDKA